MELNTALERGISTVGCCARRRRRPIDRSSTQVYFCRGAFRTLAKFVRRARLLAAAVLIDITDATHTKDVGRRKLELDQRARSLL